MALTDGHMPDRFRCGFWYAAAKCGRRKVPCTVQYARNFSRLVCLPPFLTCLLLYLCVCVSVSLRVSIHLWTRFAGFHGIEPFTKDGSLQQERAFNGRPIHRAGSRIELVNCGDWYSRHEKLIHVWFALFSWLTFECPPKVGFLNGTYDLSRVFYAIVKPIIHVAIICILCIWPCQIFRILYHSLSAIFRSSDRDKTCWERF